MSRFAAIIYRSTSRLILAMGLVGILTSSQTQRVGAQWGNFGPPAKPGVSVKDPKALKGYTLIAPLNSTKVYLIDLDGRVVKMWETGVIPGASTYLLENGHLLRAGHLGPKGTIHGAAAGGRILEFTWDGEVVWDFTYATPKSQQHHDIHKMPNGNVLMIVWDKKTKEEAIAAGRRPDTIQGDFLADAIIEVKPTGKKTGEIVWEWHAWDHLVQDYDKTKANYGNVAARPERIDINFGSGMMAGMMAKKDDLEKLKDLGYVGGGPPLPKGPGGFGGIAPDWMHSNSITYNAELDQILLSVHSFNEIWIIDHSTTTQEAAGSTGGKYGKGGDLLYRWGNPKAYRHGTNADQRLFGQHDAQWIPKGYPGAGNILIFNNGSGRPGGLYSSVDEIEPPIDATGRYTRKPGLPFGPEKSKWSYTAERKSDFFAMLISGAHRLPNGNTLICSGTNSTVFEVTPEGQTVWRFVSPSRVGLGGGGFGVFGPPPGELLPSFVQDQLQLTSEQKKQLQELQKEIDAQLEKLLSPEQRQQLQELRNRRPGRFGGGPGGFPGAPGGFGGGFAGGGPGGLFRAYRYAEDYPAFVGKNLQPGKKLEELIGTN